MTDSGYPRVMREWRRGTSLFLDSKVVHEGEASDVSVYMYVTKHAHHRYLMKGRAITFYTSSNSIFLPDGDNSSGSSSSSRSGGSGKSDSGSLRKGVSFKGEYILTVIVVVCSSKEFRAWISVNSFAIH